MKLASSLARNSAACAMSSASPARGVGVALARFCSSLVSAACSCVALADRPKRGAMSTPRGHEAADSHDVMEERLWQKSGWIARVIKNEEDEGWAVEMTRIGDDEPALVGPWTMGRDKKNPKPLDTSAFTTLVKTASEVLLRHEQSTRESLRKVRTISDDHDRRVLVELEIQQDEDDPHATLKAVDVASGDELRHIRVSPGFRLTEDSAQRFVRSGES
jgi:hypothetical protein